MNVGDASASGARPSDARAMDPQHAAIGKNSSPPPVVAPSPRASFSNARLPPSTPSGAGNNAAPQRTERHALSRGLRLTLSVLGAAGILVGGVAACVLSQILVVLLSPLVWPVMAFAGIANADEVLHMGGAFFSLPWDTIRRTILIMGDAANWGATS